MTETFATAPLPSPPAERQSPSGHSTHAVTLRADLTFSAPSNPEQRLAAREMFGRHFRGGLIVVQYNIKTRSIRQFYKRDFIYLSMLMNALDNYRSIRGVNHALLDEAEAQIASCLDATLLSLGRVNEHAAALAAEQGAADATIRYPLATRLEVPIISPLARSYMEVLAAADNAFAAVEKCWLLGLIDTRTRKSEEASLRQSIRLVSTVVRRCRNDLAGHVRSIWPGAEANNLAIHVVTNPERTAGISAADSQQAEAALFDVTSGRSTCAESQAV